MDADRDDQRAAALEQQATEALAAGDVARAIALASTALEQRRAIPDRRGEGRALTFLARAHWAAGSRPVAETLVEHAVSLLRPEPGTARELGGALGLQSRLHMLMPRPAEAIAAGTEAALLARQAGDVELQVDIEVSVAAARMLGDPDVGDPELRAAIAEAEAAGLGNVAARGRVCLSWGLLFWRRLPAACAETNRAVAAADTIGNRVMAAHANGARAQLHMLAGNWDGAASAAQRTLSERQPVHIATTDARYVLAIVAVRSGAPDARAQLERLVDEASGLEELLTLGPAVCAAAELAWLVGDEAAIPELTEPAYQLAERAGLPWLLADLGLWRMRAGVPVSPPPHCPEPQARALAGDWTGSARAWAALGAPYEQALALLGADTPEALRTAAGIARELGAAPLAARIDDRLNSLAA